MFYRALKRHGVETQMVIYPDEGHPIRQLPHQEDVLRRVLDWFQRYGETKSGD
jgi:dipeptidyl aminopeptidase/acylaminoacyl peptidase